MSEKHKVRMALLAQEAGYDLLLGHAYAAAFIAEACATEPDLADCMAGSGDTMVELSMEAAECL